MDQSVHHVVCRALELDSKGEFRAAYHDYRKALGIVLNILQEPDKMILDGNGQLHELFALAQNCFNRLQQIAILLSANAHRVGENQSGSDNDSDYLQFASEPSSRRASNKEKPNIIQGAGHVRASSVDSRPSLPSSPIKAQLSRPDSQKSIPITTVENVNFNLSAFRRAHETELVAKQKEKTRRILRARAGALVKNEEYVADLLKRRQNLLVSFNDKLSEVYRSISAKAIVIKSSIEMEIRRKSIKNAVLDLNQRGQELAIIEPVVEIFSSQTDPMAALVGDFIGRCRQQLTLAAQQPDPTTIVERIFDEINVVEHHLVELITQNFDELKEISMRASVRISIQSFFFSTSLSPALQLQIKRSTASSDDQLVEKLIDSSWNDLFALLKVRSKLQLPRGKALDAFPIRDAGIYARAIEELRCISIHMTPFEKLMCLTRCCNAICQAVDDFKRDSISADGDRGEDSSAAAPSSLGSEDLLLLCAYVIVRAHIPDLFSQLLFISKLVPEELVRGEAGYVLATMQTSLDYAIAQLGLK